MTMFRYSMNTAAISLVAVLVLAGCAHKVAVPAEGKPLNWIPAQAMEQCKAQPDFPGCHESR